jgi:hypothetical protein
MKGKDGAAMAQACVTKSMGIAEQAKSQDANQQHYAPRPVPIWIADR